MALRVKLDEDLTPIVGEPLRAAGYEVSTVVEQGWSGMKDVELRPRVVEEGLYFITADKGFGDVRAYPPGTHPGIMVLRADRESIVTYRELISGVLGKFTLDSLTGFITVATRRRIRVRRTASKGG